MYKNSYCKDPFEYTGTDIYIYIQVQNIYILSLLMLEKQNKAIFKNCISLMIG